MSDLDDLLNMIGKKNFSDEIAQLRAEHDYLWSLVPFQQGDRVVLTQVINTDNGWRPWKEVLGVGATGTVYRIEFSRYGTPGWLVYFKPEVAWSVHEGKWTDDGSKKRHYLCMYPTGDNHTFMLGARHLRLATRHDEALERPADAACWGCEACNWGKEATA